MNAVVTKPSTATWPKSLRRMKEELPGFWTFETRDGESASAHALGEYEPGKQAWIFHASRALLLRMKADGFFVRTLREILESGALAEKTLRGAYRYWIVNGTIGDRQVTDYPHVFSSKPRIGVDGEVTITALVRPYVGLEVLGDPEDPEATL